jgi:hypothetical protein
LESLEPAVVVSHISRKTSEMWGTQDLLRAYENAKKGPQISPLRCAPVEMTILFESGIPCFHERSAELQIPRLRSDDKGEGCGRGG